MTSLADGPPHHGAHALLLAVREPFAADALLAFLAVRAIPGVDEVRDGAYRRTLRLTHGHGLVELEPARGHVRCLLHLADARDLDDATRRCRALLDLDADPSAVDAHLGADAALAACVEARPGLRVPGAVDPVELAARAILGQQVSVAGARTLAARIAAEHGEPLDLGRTAAPPGAPDRLFPGAARLATLDPERLAMPRARGRALTALGRALADRAVHLTAGSDPQASRAALLAVPGVGPWTAGYVTMRALGDRDVFLPTDVAAQRGARRLGIAADPRGLAERAEAWRPYRSYALLHLWGAA